jgi:hypothetical protein
VGRLLLCLVVVAVSGCASAPADAGHVSWRLTVHVEVIEHHGSESGYWEKGGLGNASLRVDSRWVNRTDPAGNSVLAFDAAPGHHTVTALHARGNRTVDLDLVRSRAFDLDDGAPDWDHPDLWITVQP